MKTMQALQWDGHKLQVNTLPVPIPTPGEVLVRLTRAGICKTDLEIIRGYYPFQGTLGHEFVGVVEQAEDSSLVGKRVVSDINSSCGNCVMCDAGHPHHCQNRSALGIKDKDGAFAEFLTTPAANLVQIPDSLADDLAVFSEPLAAALEIQEQVDFSQHKKVVVIGDGKLGLLITMSLHQAGLDVSLIGHHPERIGNMDLYGVTFFNTAPEMTFPVVIEATGSPEGFGDAMKLTAPKGIMILKSTYKEPLKFNTAPLVVNEITLIGSRCGPMDKAVISMASGTINPSRLIQQKFPLAQAVKAVQQANKKGVLKILLTMEP